MSELIQLVNLSINQLSTKKFFENNKKFVEAITIIDNLECSFITKTAYAADLIDAFNAAFLIQNTVKITYDEIDKIINEAKNQNNDCDLGLFIKIYIMVSLIRHMKLIISTFSQWILLIQLTNSN